MRRRLLHVFPAFGEGGPEVRTAEIINKSCRLFDHHILSLSSVISGRSRLTDADKVARTSRERASLWSLAKDIRSFQPDLVLTYGWGGTDAIASARLAGIRRVVHAEDGFLDDEVRKQKWKRQLARRVVFQAAKSLVVPSQTLGVIAKSVWGVSNKRLRYIPNGIDVNRFHPPTTAERQAAKERIGLPDDATAIGIVGALRPEKNQSRLVRSFIDIASAAPRAWLIIVGDGPEMASLREQARKSGIASRVIFAGIVGDTTAYYHAMSVLAVASDTEQMPLSVLEGMASGLPILSTDVGDVRIMVSDENRSFIVPCDDERQYSEKLLTLVQEDGLRHRLGEANQDRCVELYDGQRMVNEYVELYREFTA